MSGDKMDSDDSEDKDKDDGEVDLDNIGLEDRNDLIDDENYHNEAWVSY